MTSCTEALPPLHHARAQKIGVASGGEVNSDVILESTGPRLYSSTFFQFVPEGQRHVPYPGELQARGFLAGAQPGLLRRACRAAGGSLRPRRLLPGPVVRLQGGRGLLTVRRWALLHRLGRARSGCTAWGSGSCPASGTTRPATKTWRLRWASSFLPVRHPSCVSLAFPTPSR